MINQPMPGLTPEAGDKRYLKTTGGTMTGDIAMGGKKVTGLGTPTADGDAANKKYVDDNVGGSGTFRLNYRLSTPRSIYIAGASQRLIVPGNVTITGWEVASGTYALPFVLKASDNSATITVYGNSGENGFVLYSQPMSTILAAAGDFYSAQHGANQTATISLPAYSETTIAGVGRWA